MQSEGERLKIFISHISEEGKLALALKDWIESSFAGQCSVFVSSDKDDIPAGSDWFERIDSALADSKAVIVLCSPASLSRPWINFETGCGWMKGIPIIPLCHSGQEKGKLPQPIARMQAIQLDDADSVGLLLSALAQHLKFAKVPRIDAERMRVELFAALPAEPAKQAAVASPPGSRKIEEVQVSDEMLRILKYLAALDHRETASIGDIARVFGIAHSRATLFVDRLSDTKLIDTSLNMVTGAHYSLSRKGREYLFDQGLL